MQQEEMYLFYCLVSYRTLCYPGFHGFYVKRNDVRHAVSSLWSIIDLVNNLQYKNGVKIAEQYKIIFVIGIGHKYVTKDVLIYSTKITDESRSKIFTRPAANLQKDLQTRISSGAIIIVNCQDLN